MSMRWLERVAAARARGFFDADDMWTLNHHDRCLMGEALADRGLAGHRVIWVLRRDEALGRAFLDIFLDTEVPLEQNDFAEVERRVVLAGEIADQIKRAVGEGA